MSKLTINKSDWSGEDCEILVNVSKSTVRVNSNLLKVVLKSEIVSDNSSMELCEVYFNDMQLCTGYFDNGYWYLDGGGISREGKNIYKDGTFIVQAIFVPTFIS